MRGTKRWQSTTPSHNLLRTLHCWSFFTNIACRCAGFVLRIVASFSSLLGCAWRYEDEPEMWYRCISGAPMAAVNAASAVGGASREGGSVSAFFFFLCRLRRAKAPSMLRVPPPPALDDSSPSVELLRGIAPVSGGGRGPRRKFGSHSLSTTSMGQWG